MHLQDIIPFGAFEQLQVANANTTENAPRFPGSRDPFLVEISHRVKLPKKGGFIIFLHGLLKTNEINFFSQIQSLIKEVF